MRAIDIDFVHRPKRLRFVGFALLMTAVITAAYLGQAYLELSAGLETWEAKWRSLQKAQRKESDPGSGQKVEWERLQAELKVANRVIQRLSLPWDVLFREVETSVDEQVTLLNVEPDTEKHEVRISAEAKSLAAMLDYSKRLGTIDLFKDAHVSSHQVQQQDPQKPVRFVVNAQWIDLPQPSHEAQKTVAGNASGS